MATAEPAAPARNVDAALADLEAALPERFGLGGIERTAVGAWRARADGQRGACLFGTPAATIAAAVRSLTARGREEFPHAAVRGPWSAA